MSGQQEIGSAIFALLLLEQFKEYYEEDMAATDKTGKQIITYTQEKLQYYPELGNTDFVCEETIESLFIKRTLKTHIFVHRTIDR